MLEYALTGGSGEMLPQENVDIYNCFWWLLHKSKIYGITIIFGNFGEIPSNGNDAIQ